MGTYSIPTISRGLPRRACSWNTLYTISKMDRLMSLAEVFAFYANMMAYGALIGVFLSMIYWAIRW